MSGKGIGNAQQASFDGIRHLDAEGNEHWLARELAKVLEYSEYRHFLPVIERARSACEGSGQSVSDHFEDILGMVPIGWGARRPVEDVRLSRYACYLAVQEEEVSPMARPKKAEKSPKAIASTQSLGSFVKSICDVMRRSNRAIVLDEGLGRLRSLLSADSDETAPSLVGIP